MGRGKDFANQKKHRFDFLRAASVFDDSNALLIKHRIDEDGEQRWHALGLVAVVPVYKEAEDGEEIIRIIPARKAGKREGPVYFQ